MTITSTSRPVDAERSSFHEFDVRVPLELRLDVTIRDLWELRKAVEAELRGAQLDFRALDVTPRYCSTHFGVEIKVGHPHSLEVVHAKLEMLFASVSQHQMRPLCEAPARV